MNPERRGQLSIYLENRVGALAETLRLIADQKVNLLGICAIDTVEEAVLRLLPQNAESAARTLEDAGVRVIETEVIVLDIANDAGAAGQIAARLADRGINIDYVYVTAHPGQDRALLVLRTPQLDEAERTLRSDGD